MTQQRVCRHVLTVQIHALNLLPPLPPSLPSLSLSPFGLFLSLTGFFSTQAKDQLCIQQAMQEKAEMERQHEVEVTTLSSNLGVVRLELETTRRRRKELEDSSILWQRKIEGVPQSNCCIIFLAAMHCFLVYVKHLLVGNPVWLAMKQTLSLKYVAF